MAIEARISVSDQWIIGTRRILEFEIFSETTSPLPVDPPSSAAMEDVSAWSFEWILSKRVGLVAFRQRGAAVITKTSSSGITVTGAYAATRGSNTQRVVVNVNATDWPNGLLGGAYEHALKRTNAGNEDVVSYGEVTLLEVATP